MSSGELMKMIAVRGGQLVSGFWGIFWKLVLALILIRVALIFVRAFMKSSTKKHSARAAGLEKQIKNKTKLIEKQNEGKDTAEMNSFR